MISYLDTSTYYSVLMIIPADDVFALSGRVPSLYVLTSLKSKGT